MAVDAVPVHCCLETWLVKMIYFPVFFLDGGCRERIRQMASPACYYLCLATVTMASDAVGILLQSSGGMMVAI
jgi:hypothetical protein